MGKERKQMQTIQAKVNPRLLTKASRLFTGTLEGRIIEILQNARRAGATRVEITNQPDGMVVVQDNGQGIDDFSKLLDMGGSGWDETLENSEDPAGVGLFCLAPRQVTVRSKGQMLTIAGDGWTGGLLTIEDDPEPVQGTMLCFQDEPWTSSIVELNAVFSGLRVIVNGEECPSLPFVSEKAVEYPELGYRIEVCQTDQLDGWHNSSRRGRYYSEDVLVNFHGQVVTFDYRPVTDHDLRFLVDLTGEATGIRLMLPARTQLVENEALGKLKSVIELEAFRFLQRRQRHRLTYKEYLRAKKLGVKLPEAVPTYHVGLLRGDDPQPAQVIMPEDFTLDRCYRFNLNCEGDDTDEANAHLLAALGTFETPFVPVDISPSYDGYSWANLPTIDRVEVEAGKKLHEGYIWSGTLVCVESLVVAAHTSDGKVFRSAVPIVIPPEGLREEGHEHETVVYVTPNAREHLSDSEIWHHFDGWNNGGDSYETQAYQFSEDLDRFWDQLVGPDEHLRRRILEQLDSLTGWQSVHVHADGRVVIRLKDDTEQALVPPDVAG
jgi:hypothetical protein